MLLLGWLLFGKRISWLHAAGMAVSYSGVVLVFGHEVSVQGAHTGWGTLMVLLSTISYAVYMVYSAELVQRLGSRAACRPGQRRGLRFSASPSSCCSRPVGSLAAVAPQVFWLSVLNATVCTVAPVLMVMMAIERIGAGLASQSGMVGPFATILMGVWLLDEPFTAWVAAGSVLVIAGIYVVTRANRKPGA